MKKVSHLQDMRSRRVFSVSLETTGPRMARKGFGGWNDPEFLAVLRDNELASASICELIPLELMSNVSSVFNTKVCWVCAATHAGVTVAVGSLNNHSLYYTL